MSENTYEIEIAQRPWYEWLAWLIWLFLVVFTFQNAVASTAELEPRVATILWVVEAILVAAGVIVYFVRRRGMTA